MTTLVKRLQSEYDYDYSLACLPVTYKSVTSIDSHMLVKPMNGIFSKDLDRCIALHGDHYLLVPYENILNGLSNALDKYGIDIRDAKLIFSVDSALGRMKLRILFGDTSRYGTYIMQHNSNDKLQFGIEVVSSYDASIMYKLQVMFLRLICANGMKSFETINSSLRRHTTNFVLEDSFKKLQNLNDTFDNLSNTMEAYQRVELKQEQVKDLFKDFANGSSSKEWLLHEVLENKDKPTLYDVYNSFTNYSSHNQRALSDGGTKKEPKFKLASSSMDSIKSDDRRNLEVQNFITKNKNFVYFYHQGIANSLRAN